VQVPPGEYIFEVKASNGDGFWSDEVRRLKITVLPAFWQTWWFRLLNLLLLIGVGIGFYHWRIQQLQRQQRERLELIIKTQEAERKQLATELHDDLGMRLSTLQMYLSEIDISQNSHASKLTPLLNEAIADIRNLLRDLNPKLLFEEGLRVAVEEVNTKLNAVGLVKFELLWLDFPEKLPEVIEINLFRIIQELINNTLKHAEATHITLQLLQRDARWVIIYEDNGRGFERQPLSSGFGLQNIENRVQLLKGQLHFDTAPQRGVYVTIEIPHH
jgi:signal transduction histidine kinase